MRSKTKKSVSRLVGIWTFLLLFIFKGIFPKPAYAFLSSLDACAANPECAAAVSSELAPAVSAPTGAGFGASTLSTTTAAGATTSSVQGVAEISVAARLGTLGILYYWNQSQNEQAQNKAKQKYCAANSLDLVCGGQANVLYNIEATLHSTDGTYSYDYFYGGTALGSINYAEADAPSWITGYYPPLIGIYNNDGIKTGSLGWNYVGTGGYPVNESAQVTGITITSITIQDEQPETPPLSWKDWSQEKRDEAVRLLNPSDWQGLINSMPQAGVLNPGDKIKAPTIVIPGEETDDLNTPADERLLRAEADAPSWITGYYPPLIGIYNNDGIKTGSLGWNYVGTGGYPVNESAQVTGITITSITIQDEQPETPPLSWKDWSQEKRDEAVRLLNPSDWQGLINSMPQAGVLNPGDKIKAPTIVIPGEETDDLNTPADERLLRKEHGFFTFPGLPDFDKDGIPDESDSDDDNDGTPDTNDPQPYNPNVPTASSLPDESAKVTPEVLQDIRDIVNPYENFQCVQCADEIETYLKEQGIHGERIKLDTVKLVDQDSNIYDDSHPPKAEEDGYIISTNGHHEGIAIKINGEEKVFDNLHPDAVPRQQWMNDLTYHSKVFGQSDFRKSGYLFP